MTKDEVVNALRTVVDETCELDIHVIGLSPRGQMTALVNTDLATTTKLLDKPRVRIGWVNCRIRERVSAQRCIKCLGYGHPKAKCGGPDRSNCRQLLALRRARKQSRGMQCESGVLSLRGGWKYWGCSGKCLCFRRALNAANQVRKWLKYSKETWTGRY